MVVVVEESSVSTFFSSALALNLSHKSCRVKDVVSDQGAYLTSVVVVAEENEEAEGSGIISVYVLFQILKRPINRLEQPSCWNACAK